MPKKRIGRITVTRKATVRTTVTRRVTTRTLGTSIPVWQCPYCDGTFRATDEQFAFSGTAVCSNGQQLALHPDRTVDLIDNSSSFLGF